MTGDTHAPFFDRVRSAILETPGDTEPELRRRAAAGEAADPYLDKVRRHAYRVVEADLDAMRAAGHSEAAIYELTLAAAFGAAQERLAAGLRALD